MDMSCEYLLGPALNAPIKKTTGGDNTQTVILTLPADNYSWHYEIRILRAVEEEGDNVKTRDFPARFYILYCTNCLDPSE
jgi:hypothetical protein